MLILTHQDYKVGWICALYMELSASMAMLDEQHEVLPQDPDDDNAYVLGRIGRHNVVIASLPDGEIGTSAAKYVATQMRRSFKEIRFGLMVGIAGGAPNLEKGRDIRLGDIVVSSPTGQHGGVLQYEYGTTTPDSFNRKGFLHAPPQVLRTAITKLRAEHHSQNGNRIPDYLSPTNNKKLSPQFTYPTTELDELFEAGYRHVGNQNTCVDCDRAYLVKRPPRSLDPVVHYGTIGSGSQVVKSGVKRDEEAMKHNLLCFEMEAAGLMNTFPCIIIRGISDYADSHKNNRWKDYAAATAAAYAKELLRFIAPERVNDTAPIQPSLEPPIVASSSAEASATPASLQVPTIGAECDQRALDTSAVPPQNQSTQSDEGNSRAIPCFSVFPGRFLNWDEVALGRLVLDLRHPEQDFCPHTVPLAPEEISIFPFEEIEPILNRRGVCRSSALLAKLIFGLFPNNGNVEYVMRRSIVYKLLNSGAFLDRLTKDEAIKRWLESIYQRSYVYLAVSIHSIVLSVIGDKSNDLANTVLTTRQLSPGDRIIGVQYRKLRFRSFNSKTDPIATLNSGCWKKYNRDNVGRGDEGDILEASLSDDTDLDGLDDEYQFEVYISEKTGEKFVLMVKIFMNQQCAN